MENTSIINASSYKSERFNILVGVILALICAVFSFSVNAADYEDLYQQSHLRPEIPHSPHVLHWQKNRSFSLQFTNRQSEYDEKNGNNKASFAEQETMVDGVFQRQVSPSIALLTSLTHVKGDSRFNSEHAGITSDVDRKVRSSLASIASSYKIMDALILALKIGYQVSQLEFSQSDTFSNRAYRLSPAVAWKSSVFEVAVYQARIYRSKSSATNKQQFAEQGLIFSSMQESDWQWQIWLQQNPQPVCCAFVDGKRSVYGGRVFLPVASFTVSPGYRFLSEFQVNQQPGTIEDVSRHNVFLNASSDWDEWKPSINISYDFAAKDTAPSSFGSTAGTSISTRSDVKARTLQFGVGLGRVW